MSPVALRVQVAEVEPILIAKLDRRNGDRVPNYLYDYLR